MSRLRSTSFTIIKSVLRANEFWRRNWLILRELRDFRRHIFLAFLFSIASAATAAVSIGLIGSLLQGLTSPNVPPLQTGLDWLDRHVLGIYAAAPLRVYRLAGLTLGVTWLQMMCAYWGQLYSRYVAIDLVNRIRKLIFEQLQSFQVGYYITTDTGALINTVTSEVQQIQQALITMSTLITQLFMLMGYGVSMLVLSWPLTLASVVIFSLLSILISVIKTKVKQASLEIPKANKQFTSITLEFISGIRTIHASSAEDYERQRYYHAANIVRKAVRQVAKRALAVMPLTQGMASTLLIFLIAIAYTILVRSGNLQASSLLAFLFAMSRTLPLVSQISNGQVSISSLEGPLYNVSELLKRSDKPYFQDGFRVFPGLQQGIELVDVGFGYDSDGLILKDIHLTIPQGQTVALVGPSGSGKTTLANLLCRFFDPTTGQILLDGVDLRDLKIQSLRSKMAVVSQDTFIFNASVRQNIAYGFPEISEQALLEAAELANALDFIQAMPAGFETQLGDRGIRLSGGQRQRIAIARALLRNPEILILDEATSALDSITERLIQDSLTKLVVGRTVISIAHRLSTIATADKVVVLENGRIVEQGPYRELLEQKGKFWEYHQIQYAQS